MLTGVGALVHAIARNRRRDLAAGHRTGAFVSGYPGSPLAGLDLELSRHAESLARLGVVHRPGVNEELAATAVAGSQLAAGLPGARVDGVTGWWYGKAPGLDRAVDALRHGNVAGTGPLGGVVLLVGDDPEAKSSTLPSASEGTLRDLLVPVFYPGSAAEIGPLADHAVALSRASGLWAALKIVASVADGSVTVAARRAGPRTDGGLSATDGGLGSADGGLGVDPVIPVVEHRGRPYTHRPTGRLLPPATLDLEEALHTVRLEIARRYGRENGLNRVVVRGPADRLGVVVPGRLYRDLRQGLADEGVTDDMLRAAGVRLLHLALLWPLDPALSREFGRGLDEVLVLEEKQAFVEPGVRDALYGLPDAPRVVGRHDEHGHPLVPAHGVLTAARLAELVRARCAGRLPRPRTTLTVLPTRARPVPVGSGSAATRAATPAGMPARTPAYCSGCPHNLSTQVPDPTTLVGAGIGCHAMVTWADPDRFGQVVGITQMGGEGAQWVGAEPFVEPAATRQGFVQNLGDGTYFHSGQLAVRQAVAAGATLTFKILYNGAVAMTGGQDPTGRVGVPELTRMLELEGVTRTIVTTEDPRRYRRARLAGNAQVWHRDRLAEAQRALGARTGVTVLVHDQRCAAETRRDRARGVAAAPTEIVVINERVCEGCGDCAAVSNCLSLHPVDTELGPRTRIDQSSCNLDRSCVRGDCPSFVTVPAPRGVTPGQSGAGPADAVSGAGSPRWAAALPPPHCPPAVPPAPDGPGGGFAVRMVGVGGTGVVTVNHILLAAAARDGLHAAALDQTGLAQKGGPVVSELRIGTAPPDGNRVGPAGCDVLLAFDPLGATSPPTLAALDPRRSSVVAASTAAPTIQMVTDARLRAPDPTTLRAVLAERTSPGRVNVIDARRIATELVGDPMGANLVLLGAAWQTGLLPLSLEALLAAITGGNTGAAGRAGGRGARDLAAFGWGRAAVAHPEVVAGRLAQTPARFRLPAAARGRDLVDGAFPADGPARAAADRAGLLDLVAARAADLRDYQNRRYALDYVAFVATVAAAEVDRLAGSTRLAEAVARGLHRLLAYKDEYEVARLHLRFHADVRAAAAAAGTDHADIRDGAVAAPAGPRGPRWPWGLGGLRWHLRPPLLRALGVNRKIRVGGPLGVLALRSLVGLRRLRGTPFDPFGYTALRRTERALIAEYRAAVLATLPGLTAATAETALAVAGAAELVRGYERVKLASVDAFRAALGGPSSGHGHADVDGGQGRVHRGAAGQAEDRETASGRVG
ncbi:indolepyruvate ferredoxin oxidoreductase family protein [Frankia nepalensis]|uniref:indolepyruvate ferredoxin oxidoreductase family protein n=1 Tax=Frankia nepalensis TaxID=1836974 RepID=UPI0019331913|nr:indolepyruvate ferredoxin oxidoreductase family protein [Frankia nepalensis]